MTILKVVQNIACNLYNNTQVHLRLAVPFVARILTSNGLDTFPSTTIISDKDPSLSLTAYSVFWKPTSIRTPALVEHTFV